jgi:predicted nuclease of predicted toxin-antitoxin system
MRFLVDAQLPPSLCKLLNAAGHDAIHTSELPASNRTTDRVINDLAAQQGRVVISKDTDFYYSHVLSQRPPKLLLVRTGNIRVKDLKDLFERHLPSIVQALEASSLVELDRSAIRIVV